MSTQLDASIGLAAESTYGTTVTPSKFLEFTSESLDWMPTFVQGAGLRVSSRVVRSARRGLGKQQAGGDITVEACSKGLGALLQAALGVVTTTQRGTTGVYQQVHTPLTSDYLGSYTIQKGVPLLGGATVAHTFSGAVCSKLAVSVPNNGITTLTTTWDAQKVDTSTAYATPAYATPVELFEFVEGSIVVGGSPTAPTTTALATGGTTVADIRDWSLSWDNAIDDGGFNLGSGGKRARKPAVGLSALTGSMTAEFDSTTLRDAYLGQLDLAMYVTLVGSSTIGTADHPALQFYIPNIRLEGELPKVGGSGVVTQSVNWTGFDNLSGSAPVTVVYVSTDTAP